MKKMKKCAMATLLTISMTFSGMTTVAFAEDGASQDIFISDETTVDAAQFMSGTISDGVGTNTTTAEEITDGEITDTDVLADGTETAVARIGETTYATLDDAVNAVLDAKETGEIELLKDASLTVNTIDKPICIIGNSHTIDVPSQPETVDGRLNVNSTLTFKKVNVNFSNKRDKETWSVVMGPDNNAAHCVLNLLDNTVCHFENSGIYAGSGSAINIDSSTLKLEKMPYTAMMSVKYSYLNLLNGSSLFIDNIAAQNGLNNYITRVDNSEIKITNCKKQGIVGGSLELLNGSIADISNNATAINTFGNKFEDAQGLFRRNAVVVNDGTKLIMNNNNSHALTLQGSGDFIVKSGGTVEAKYNGLAYDENHANQAHYFLDATIGIGAWYDTVKDTVKYEYFWTSSRLCFEDGANVAITDNYIRGVVNNGVDSYIGNGTTIMRNKADTNEAEAYGGGIFNLRTLTLHKDAKVYNNHAGTAGDDIYNVASGSYPSVDNDAIITFGATGSDWKLDGTPDCNGEIHAIDGWYDDSVLVEGDSTTGRWNAHTAPYHADMVEAGTITGPKALKAAHGLLTKVLNEFSDETLVTRLTYLEEKPENGRAFKNGHTYVTVNVKAASEEEGVWYPIADSSKKTGKKTSNQYNRPIGYEYNVKINPEDDTLTIAFDDNLVYASVGAYVWNEAPKNAKNAPKHYADSVTVKMPEGYKDTVDLYVHIESLAWYSYQ